MILPQQVSLSEAQSLGPLIESDSRFPNRTTMQFTQMIDRANIQIEVDVDFFVRMAGPVGNVAAGPLSNELLVEHRSHVGS